MLINFIGLDSNIGTSTAALMIANEIRLMTGKKVAVLTMQTYSTGTIQNYDAKYLDELKYILTQNILDIKLSHYAKEMYEDVYYLAGNRKATLQHDYTVEEAKKLITLARKEFDFVIMDSGHLINNPFSVVAIESSHINAIVTNQSIKSLEAKFKVLEILDMMEVKPQILIVNQYQPKQVVEMDDLKNEFNIEATFKLPYLQKLFNQPTGYELLQLMNKDVHVVAKYILNLLEYPIQKEVGLLKRLYFKLKKVN